jgi:hypothetical protein
MLSINEEDEMHSELENSHFENITSEPISSDQCIQTFNLI